MNHIKTISLIFSIFLISLVNISSAKAQNRFSDVAFDELNNRRKAADLPELIRDTNLDNSAGAHVNYITANSSLMTEGHLEAPGKKGYSGVTPEQRMRKFGYSSIASGENYSMISFPIGSLSTTNLIDAPYHRESQFGMFKDAGVGMGTQVAPSGSVNREQYVYVINFGNKSTIKVAANYLFVYPVQNQKNVTADWVVNETPNPLPEMSGKRVGYPISIAAAPGNKLEVKSFTLTSADQAISESRLITTNTQSQKKLESYAFLIPIKPLSYDSTYQAQVIGTINGINFIKEWSFTTRKKLPLKLIPSSSSLAGASNSELNVQITGGTGNGYVIYSVRQSFNIDDQSTSGKGISLYSVEYPTPDSIKLIRNTTPCSYPISDCELVVSGRDSSGDEITLGSPIY